MPWYPRKPVNHFVIPLPEAFRELKSCPAILLFQDMDKIDQIKHTKDKSQYCKEKFKSLLYRPEQGILNHAKKGSDRKSQKQIGKKFSCQIGETSPVKAAFRHKKYGQNHQQH